MHTRSLAAALLSVLLVALPGCGGSDQPELGLVTGTVTLDGQPAPGVEVAFHPDGGRPAFGTTDSTGKYSLEYKPQQLGCKVGTSRVTIGASEGAADDAQEEGDDAVQTPGKKGLVIPAQYNTESELSRDVKAGDNVFDFDLKSKS